MAVLTLITGATGLLGNNIARLLVEAGEPLRALVRPGHDPRPLRDLEIELVEGDIRDPAAVLRATRGASAVIHAAALVAIGRTKLDLHRATNVDGTLNVARAARDAGARLLHVSSIDALGAGSAELPADEESPGPVVSYCPYSVTKWEGERVVLDLAAEGLDAVIVNPGFMIGPWDWKPSSGRMILEVASGKGLLAPRGIHSYCDARDVARGAISALRRGRSGSRYILTGESLTYLEAWRTLAEVTGARPPVREVPTALLRFAGAIGDLWTRVSGTETQLNSAATRMAHLERFCSSDRARRELGYSSRDLRESATAAWSWFRSEGYASA